MSLLAWWPEDGTQIDKCGEYPLFYDASSLPKIHGKTGEACQSYYQGTMIFTELAGKKVFSFNVWAYVSSTECTSHYSNIGRFTVIDSSTNGIGYVRFDNERYSTYTDRCMHVHDNTTAAHFMSGNGALTSVNGGMVESYDHWHMYTMTSDGTTFKCFVDGQLRVTGIVNTGSVTLNGAFSQNTIVGCYLNDSRVYSHCLTQHEIDELYKCCIVHYTFNTLDSLPCTNLDPHSYEMKCGGQAYDKKFTPSMWGSNTGYVYNRSSGGWCDMPVSVWYKTGGNSGGGFYTWLDRGFTIEAGKTYTMSVYAKCNKDSATMNSNYTLCINSAALSNHYITAGGATMTLTRDWQRFTKTFTATSADAATDYCFSPLIYNNFTDDEYAIEPFIVYFSAFQIEEGSIATSYTRYGYPRTESIIPDCSGYGNDATLMHSASMTKSSDIREYSLLTNASSPSASNDANSNYLISTLNSAIYPDNTDAFTMIIRRKVITAGYQDSGIMTIGLASDSLNYQHATVSQFDGKYYGNTADPRGTSYSISCDATATGTWVHDAIVFDKISGTTKYYKNGVLTTTAASTSLHEFDTIRLGLDTAGGAYRNVNMNVSDFKIFTSALTAQDILDDYNYNSVKIGKNKNIFSPAFTENSRNMAYKMNWTLGSHTDDTTTINENGVYSFTQTNCKEYLTSKGYRIYRTPGVVCSWSNTSGYTFGGMVLRFLDLGNKETVSYTNSETNESLTYTSSDFFTKGHRYRWSFHISGYSSDAFKRLFVVNNYGWYSGGLVPSPTDVVSNYPNYANFGLNHASLLGKQNTAYSTGSSPAYREFSPLQDGTFKCGWGTDCKLYDTPDIAGHKYFIFAKVTDFTDYKFDYMGYSSYAMSTNTSDGYCYAVFDGDASKTTSNAIKAICFNSVSDAADKTIECMGLIDITADGYTGETTADTVYNYYKNNLTRYVNGEFTGDQMDCYYEFTIDDDIYKTCTTAYSSYIKGNIYPSYNDFVFGFEYSNTGVYGTDIYVTNIVMEDITYEDKKENNISADGVFAGSFIEGCNTAAINKTKSMTASSLIEE